jgi:RNA polymerase sigma factor (sigma-70 family)
VSAALPPEIARLFEAADQAAREQAWEAFVAFYSRLLLHTARSIGRGYDAAMDAYAHVLEALRQDDFRRLRAYAPMPGSKFTTWLVMVARRLCVDHVRRRYGQPRGEGAASEQVRLVRTRLADLLAEDIDPDHLSESADAGPDAELRSRELQRAVGSSVDELEPRDRLLLALRFDDGRTAREIAAIMHFPTTFHVYRRLTAVLGALKTSLRRRGIEGPTP